MNLLVLAIFLNLRSDLSDAWLPHLPDPFSDQWITPRSGGMIKPHGYRCASFLFAISSAGGLITSSISHLINNLRSFLDLPSEFDPERIYRKKGGDADSDFQKTLPSLDCFACLVHYRGRMPVWIPVIRVAVRQRVTHPLAYGLLSRNSSTHTLTPTSRTFTLGMKHRGVGPI